MRRDRSSVLTTSYLLIANVLFARAPIFGANAVLPHGALAFPFTGGRSGHNGHGSRLG